MPEPTLQDLMAMNSVFVIAEDFDAAVTLAHEFALALADLLRNDLDHAPTDGEPCDCRWCALLDRHLPNWRDHARD